jgi:mono/diheme cytochrome c family protein
MRDFFRGYASARSSALAAYDLPKLAPVQRGGVLFTVGDFGALDTDALETHAVPWRLAGAALALREHDRSGAPLSSDTLRSVMRGFGFLYPDTLANWPDGAPPPALSGPLGLNVGVVQRRIPRVELTVANLGCASCHAGVTYDARGAPQPGRAWLGAPNTSLDLEAYVQAVYAAFASYGNAPEKMLAAVPQVFPDTTEEELKSLKSFVLPRVKARMTRIAKAGGGPLPFVNGAPGLTNGVAALRMQLGVLPADSHASQRGFTAIPDLGDRAMRSSLLYDGAYAPAGFVQDRAMTRTDANAAHRDGLAIVTAFFTVPSMGVHPDRARGYLQDAKAVFQFFEAYAPPRYPGAVDRGKARAGQGIYASRCASCHGVYDASLVNPRLLTFPNRIAPYDTDPTRAGAFASEVAAAVKRSAYGDLLVARATGGYAAPPLTGVWMSAPYFHNGSVPTLRHVLTPAERPTRFMVGGHRLDYRTVGIDGRRAANGDWIYPQGYRPFSTPALIDTTAPGLSNKGHERDVAGLSARERDALIEYLKLL